MDIREVRRRNLRALMDREFAGVRGAQSRLAEKLDKPQNFVSRCLADPDKAGAKTIGEDFAREIEAAFGLERYTLDSESMGLIAATTSEHNVGPGPEIKGRIPLISWVQAGDWCEAIDNFAPGDAEDWLPCPFDHSDTAFCLRVVGLSMSPDYREGEIIAVDPHVNAVHGSDVVCRTPEGTVTFKRLQITPDGTYLLALNPEWPNRMIAIPGETHICGVVVGSWMRR